MLLRVPMKTLEAGFKIEPDALRLLVDFGHVGAELTVKKDHDILSEQTSFRFMLDNHGGPPPAQMVLRGRWVDFSIEKALVAELSVPRRRGSELARLIGVPLPDRHIVIAAFLADAMAFAGWPPSTHVSNVTESAGVIDGLIISGDGDAKEPFNIQLASSMKVTCKPHPKTVLTVSRYAMEDLSGR